MVGKLNFESINDSKGFLGVILGKLKNAMVLK